MARKNPAATFLIIIAVLSVVVGLSKVLLSVFDSEAMRMAFVPTHSIADEQMPPAPDYNKDDAWAALPLSAEDLRAWRIRLHNENPDHSFDIQFAKSDIFFIHPTTHMKPTQWNAAFNDASALPMLNNIVLKNMASAFDGNFYVPRYRQATTGAFYDESGQGEIAQNRAYQDILAAYDNFMARRDKSRPFTLVGHSQGALHLLNLLKDRVAESQERSHLIAAYILGWPVSIEEDLQAIGMKACKSESETGCILSWMSYAEGADTTELSTWYNGSNGLSGKTKAGSTMLCTNPLSWAVGGKADASLNMGSVVLTPGDATMPDPIANLTGASCRDGFLFVSSNLGPSWQKMDLGGGNLHWYDINLFHANIKDNILVRADAWSR